MAHHSVVQAVEARLAAGFTACPIFVENDASETPADGSAFGVLQFPYSRSEQASIGDPGGNWYREEGGFRIVLAVERGAGTLIGRQWLEEVASLFRGKSFDGVRTYAPGSASTDDNSEDGVFFRLSIAIPYDFHITG
jgi:hypothetical protein